MSLILNIETSTSVCSVALSEGEEVVFEKASFEGRLMRRYWAFIWKRH